MDLNQNFTNRIVMALVYSCCFWFSLRLGGILIASFSIGLALLICCCVTYSQEQSVKDLTATFIDSMNLIYSKSYFENFHADPQKYLSLGITLSCIYIVICLCYAYGAYKFNNILMIGYILVELLRLIFLAFIIVTLLLVLKENTMDIGIHIGTSVVGSFFLLGMIYLWVCAANLPILINEMISDEQNAIIHKLQKMVNSMTVPASQNAAMVASRKDLNLYDKPVFTLETSKFQRNIKQSSLNNFQHSKPFSQFNY